MVDSPHHTSDRQGVAAAKEVGPVGEWRLRLPASQHRLGASPTAFRAVPSERVGVPVWWAARAWVPISGRMRSLVLR